MTDESERDSIATIRADLAAWSAGKPKAVQNAVRNLDGWLVAAGALRAPNVPVREDFRVDVLACTARAVETLRAAVTDTQHHQVLKPQ